MQTSNLPAARLEIDKARALGAHANRCDSLRWQVAMLQGDLLAAWQCSDAIRTRGLPDAHRFWNGEDLRGARIIVRCLHGFGDAVQMLRYASALAQLAASVIYEVPPRMLTLATCFRGVGQVITWGEHAPAQAPVYDVQVEIVELPYIFRTQPAELPVALQYLELPAALLAEIAASMGPRARGRAGIVWAAGEWNPARSIPVGCLAPLLAHSACEFWSLQGDPFRTALDGVLDATSICGDGLLALAATIANLDLVITVDTLAAHLAGALGKPCFLLLQHAADWRWQVDRTDSPWYPTLRLFRQPTPGDWPGVLDEVCQALTKEHFA